MKIVTAVLAVAIQLLRVDGLSVVTGANGYLGQAVCHTLLSSADTNNRETCLLLVRPEKVAETAKCWEPYSNARVLPYDMLDGGNSLRQAITQYGVNNIDETTTIYHIASVFGPTKDHEATARDNVRGTENLVKTLADIGNCRLVLTSSMAAVRGSGQAPGNGSFYTADDWNTESKLGATWGSSYQWSKMESERIAWQLCKQYGIPMTSLCPSFLFGPSVVSISSSSSYSLQLVREWLTGQSPVQSRLFVDVRDAALAHVRAGHLDKAIGKRYIVSTERRVPSTEIASWLVESLSRIYGEIYPENVHCDTTFSGGAIDIGNKEVEAANILQHDLGITLRSLRETISDMSDGLLSAIECK
jgi:nucleoside-diphosphate-sugar epimerase